jgi:pilus assembly protein TadC
MQEQLIALLLSVLGLAIPAAVFAYAVRRRNKKDEAGNAKR